MDQSAPDGDIADNRAQNRFEVALDGKTALLVYQRDAAALTLVHTEVPPALRGRHLGDRLVEAARHAAAADGLRLVAVCPFARAYLQRHP